MNLRSAFSIVAGLAVGGLAFGADAAGESQPPEDPLLQAVAQSSTGFAAGLYAHLKAQPGNLFIAPFGLSQALVPLAAGARGTTEEELTKVLHLTVPVLDAADGYAALSRRLQLAAGGESALSFAKALWVQQWNTISSDYVEVLREHCRSELRVIDFADGENAAHWINKWVSDRTGERIPGLANPQSFDAGTRLVVGNAVCFRAGWAATFDPAQTTASPFFAATESEPVAVPTMRQTAPYRVASQAGFRLLQMPYRGDRLVMVLLLPEADASLPQIEEGLTAELIAECLRNVQRAEPARVDLSLPRFKAERPVAQLTAALQEMGARLVFDPNGAADMSGFGTNFDGETIHLSAVDHLAKFAVDETGAEPVAGVGAGPVSGPAPVAAPAAAPVVEGAAPAVPAQPAVAFTVDRPFLFFICDPATGSLLFMGRVVDPRVG
ncbi:MAG: serpin family protein [Opitutaceae bacterium]|nr:serpin family protein [Opitutaceae bacterium]